MESGEELEEEAEKASPPPFWRYTGIGGETLVNGGSQLMILQLAYLSI